MHAWMLRETMKRNGTNAMYQVGWRNGCLPSGLSAPSCQSALNQVNQHIHDSSRKREHLLHILIVWLFTMYPQQASDSKAKPFRNCIRWKELSSTMYCLIIISNNFQLSNNFSSSLPPSNTNLPLNYHQHSHKSRHLRKQPASPPAAVPSCDSSRFEPLRVLRNTDLNPG